MNAQTIKDMNVGLKFTWPILIFLIVQTCTVVWWASHISSSVDYLTESARNRDLEVHRLSTTQYKGVQAERAHRQLEGRINEACGRLGRLEALLLKKNL